MAPHITSCLLLLHYSPWGWIKTTIKCSVPFFPRGHIILGLFTRTAAICGLYLGSICILGEGGGWSFLPDEHGHFTGYASKNTPSYRAQLCLNTIWKITVSLSILFGPFPLSTHALYSTLCTMISWLCQRARGTKRITAFLTQELPSEP